MVHQIWDADLEMKLALEKVKAIILTEQLHLHPAIDKKIHEYVQAPGKYLRAGLCLHFARLVDGAISPAKLYFAAYIETLHLATLMHDDVIDGAEKRRGILAAHQTFSNRIAIYTGDYLLAFSGRLLVRGLEELGMQEKDKEKVNDRLLEYLLRGELAQLMNQYNTDMTLKAYLKQIQGKTALLFGLACQLGAYQKDQPAGKHRVAFRFGRSLGMGFQIRDDRIDYQKDGRNSGKPGLQDIANGIYTAPLLFALQEDSSLRTDLLLLAQEPENTDLIQLIYQKVLASSGLEKAAQLMKAYEKKAKKELEYFSPSPNRTHLEGILEMIFKG
ncbi:TPA: polyprenyl synthetase family protein [Streptococcus suis]|nr:polyprenyl synthetase family protein [Streptococcus suis]